MRKSCIYFDNNSTTLPYPQVVSVVGQAMTEYYANPFTQYKIGKDAHKAMEKSRENMKKILGIPKNENLLFTASATESNNMVIRGRVAMFKKPPHVIISSIEHSSVYKTCCDLQKTKQCTLSIIPTDHRGVLNLQKLAIEVQKNRKRLALISLIWANNETGVIQDLNAISKICKGHFLHMDATQYIGKYPIKISSLGINSMTMGAHKFNGPRIGALYLKKINQIRNVFCTGGRSEQGLRSGTPNIPYVLGMETALMINTKDYKKNIQKVSSLRDYLENLLKKTFTNIKINSENAPRLYNTISVILPIYGRSKNLVRYFNRYNICVNIGSACNHNKRSRILAALGLSKTEKDSTLRISLSASNTKKECQTFVSVLQHFLR